MNIRTLGTAMLVAATMLTTLSAYPPSTASDLYFEALRYQESQGDLTKAIATYKALVDRFPGDAIVPRALLQLADCYEKTGSVEAANLYARIIATYGNTASAVTARARLAKLDQRHAAAAERQVWDRGADRIAPDGTYLAFIDWAAPVNSQSGSELAVREIPSGRVRNVTANVKEPRSYAEDVVPSPDGKQLLYNWCCGGTNGYQLRVISRDGGAPRILVDLSSGGYLMPLGWLPDGKRVAYEQGRESPDANTPGIRDVVVMPLAGGSPKVVGHLPPAWDYDTARVSPSENFLAFEMVQAAGKPERDIYMMSLVDGRTTPLAPHLADERLLDWYPTGNRILFTSDRNGEPGIWSIGVVDGRAQGEPALVRADTGVIGPIGFTRNGDYYYRRSKQEAVIQLAALDGSGRLAGAMARVQGRFETGQTQASWSPDGSRFAYIQATKLDSGKRATSGAQANKQLAIQTFASGEVRLYPLEMSNMQRPTWSPDGGTVFLQGTANAGQGIYRVDLANGRLTPIRVRATGPNAVVDRVGVTANDPSRGAPVGLPDNKSLLVATSYGTGSASGADLRQLDLATNTERILLPEVNSFSLSPDGRTVATRERRSTDGRIVILPVSGGDKAFVSVGAGADSAAPFAWTTDGRAVLAFRQGKANRELWIFPIDGTAARDTGIRVTGAVNGISVNRDGRLAISTDGITSTTWVLPGIK
jgi:Tol biopolymer transport system component